MPPDSLGLGATWAGAALAATAVPLLLMAGTSFLKITVVLSLVRRGLGVVESVPIALVLAVALLLTMHVMAPVAGRVAGAVGPLPEAPSAADWLGAAGRAAGPVGDFLRSNADAGELALFREIGGDPGGASLLTLLPAFAITELREAFWAGFLLLLPFLALDLVVAAVLASAGLTALPVATIALPLKLLLFVAVDGWALLARGLVVGY